MTLTDKINNLEIQISILHRTPSNVCGGSKAYMSGKQTYLTPAAQRKADKLNAQLIALYDQCEIEISSTKAK